MDGQTLVALVLALGRSYCAPYSLPWPGKDLHDQTIVRLVTYSTLSHSGVSSIGCEVWELCVYEGENKTGAKKEYER